MRRRDFIQLSVGATMAAPLPPAFAQQPRRPVVGWLSTRSRQTDEQVLPAFRRSMREHGFVEGESVSIDFRWANGRYDELPRLADEMIARKVDVIAHPGAQAVSFHVVKRISAVVPVVFITGSDPVNLGVVSSFNRPGGNITGVAVLFHELGPKRLGLLRELLPRARRIAVLVNPANVNVGNASALSSLTETRQAALALGIAIDTYNASTPDEINAAFAAMAIDRAEALMVVTDPFLFTQADRIVALTARLGIPAIYSRQEFAAAGGLISYGTDSEESSRILGDYIGRILKGAKAADLPVVQPTRFKLSLNLRTARTLGLEFPATLLTIADEVIE